MIVPIRDRGDPRLAAYRHIGDHLWLAARDLFVAEGRLIVRRVLAQGRLDVESILVTPAALLALQEPLRGTASAVFVLPPAAMRQLTGFNFHRGCLALVRRPPSLALDELLPCPLLLGMEGIGNPDNVGGLFRTAAAFGAAVLLDSASGDPFYRKAVRTSMGAVLTTKFAQVVSWRHALERLAEGTVRVAALTPDRSAAALQHWVMTLRPNQSVALLVGSEGHGLSADSLSLAGDRVWIPIAPGVDSLNVVVAAGIALAGVAAAAGSAR